MSTDTITVTMPGMWWRCTDGSCHTLVFKADAPHSPTLQATGRTWAALMALVDDIGLETDIQEADVKGGHLPEQARLWPGHSLAVGVFWKEFRGKPICFERRTEDTRLQLRADTYDEFVEWCERFGIDVPPKTAIKTLRQMGIAS